MTPVPCCAAPVATDEGDGFTSLECPICGCRVAAIDADAVRRWNDYMIGGDVDDE